MSACRQDSVIGRAWPSLRSLPSVFRGSPERLATTVAFFVNSLDFHPRERFFQGVGSVGLCAATPRAKPADRGFSAKTYRLAAYSPLPFQNRPRDDHSHGVRQNSRPSLYGPLTSPILPARIVVRAIFHWPFSPAPQQTLWTSQLGTTSPIPGQGRLPLLTASFRFIATNRSLAKPLAQFLARKIGGGTECRMLNPTPPVPSPKSQIRNQSPPRCPMVPRVHRSIAP